MNKNTFEFEVYWFKTKYEEGLPDECWIWKAAVSGKKYGKHWYNGKSIDAHRFAYLIAHPDFDQSLYVLHKCDNMLCVNPGHLFLGTPSDNMKDAMNKNRVAYGEMNGASVLTEFQVLKIREQYATGLYSQRSIAEVYRVSHTLIGKIVRNEYWRRLESADSGTKPAIQGN